MKQGCRSWNRLCSAFQNDEKCYDEGGGFYDLEIALLVANVVEKGAKPARYICRMEKYFTISTQERVMKADRQSNSRLI